MCDMRGRQTVGWETWMDGTHMTVDFTEMEQYLTYLTEHGRKDPTLRTVRMTLTRLLKKLDEAGRPTSMDDVTLDDAIWLYSSLDVRESARYEYMRIFSRMSVFYDHADWLRKMDILHNRPEPVRVWITLEDFAAMYRIAEPWDRMILVLGGFMGLRRTEIANLLDKDIDLRRRKMIVHGKGHGKDGLVIEMDIPEDVVREIESFRAYKATHLDPAQGDDVGHLIQVPKWGRWVGLKTNALGRHIDRLGERVGIKATTHSLRRLYATTLVNDVGADVDTVRRLMRHADVSTTLRCYVHADPTKQLAAQGDLMSVYSRALGKT